MIEEARGWGVGARSGQRDANSLVATEPQVSGRHVFVAGRRPASRENSAAGVGRCRQIDAHGSGPGALAAHADRVLAGCDGLRHRDGNQHAAAVGLTGCAADGRPRRRNQRDVDVARGDSGAELGDNPETRQRGRRRRAL